MYEEHIRAAARSMAENMQRSPVPMYGKGLRLPDKGAVIGLLKEIRRLVFPAYYGDPELMTLPVEDYTALLLERIEGRLARQIALALPEEQEQRYLIPALLLQRHIHLSGAVHVLQQTLQELPNTAGVVVVADLGCRLLLRGLLHRLRLRLFRLLLLRFGPHFRLFTSALGSGFFSTFLVGSAFFSSGSSVP